MTNKTGRDLRQPLENAQDRVEETGLVRFRLGRRRRHGGRAERWHETGQLGPVGAEDRLQLIGVE